MDFNGIYYFAERDAAQLNRIPDENQQTNLPVMPERSFGWLIRFGHSKLFARINSRACAK